MAARKGNKYYLLAKSWREKDYTPEELLACAEACLKWCKENPLIEIDYRGKDLERIELPKLRATTLYRFFVFAEISRTTFETYEKLQAYSAITTRIRNMFTANNVEGAAGGFLNPNIIARIEGLSERQELTGPGGQPLQLNTIEILYIGPNIHIAESEKEIKEIEGIVE